MKLMASLSLGSGPRTGSARGYTSELLELIEEPFHEITFLIHLLVIIALDLAVAPWRDHRLDISRLERGDEPVRVVSLAGNKSVCAGIGQQLVRGVDIVDLTRRQGEIHGIAQGIDEGVELAGQAAPRASDGLVLTPFLRAPAPC